MKPDTTANRHRIDVAQLDFDGDGNLAETYRAWCWCGWKGPFRPTWIASFDDGARHTDGPALPADLAAAQKAYGA